MKKSLLTIDSFYEKADQMRSHFEGRFADPRSADPERFVWDYWHVPGQYTALRTPAYHFFPPKIYEAFHNHLVWWGRRNLGCHDISPPWLSCYVDGCKQDLHGDLPHGPWAFVYSLTPWKKRKFRGGETLLLREEILSYWQGFKSNRGLEREDIQTEVPALFNRLTVFDPRIPHGVKEVEGVRDLLEGRLVIHGWFVQPRPFIQGSLATTELQKLVDEITASLNELFAEGLEIYGTLSLHFPISSRGEVGKITVLSNALRHPRGDQQIERALVLHIRKMITRFGFGKLRGVSEVTLPLVFEAQ